MSTLLKYQASFWKPASSTDPTQVPATGSSVTVYKQGATVRTTTIIYEGITNDVDVESGHGLTPGDQVTNGLGGADVFLVESVASSGISVGISSDVSGLVSFAAGVRLIVVNNVPPLYSDPAGSHSISTVPVGANGFLVFYCASQNFDYSLSGGGITTRLYVNAVGYLARTPIESLNARDFPTLQAAVTACPVGGKVYVPAGTYVAPSGGLVIDKSIELFGDGPNSTIITPYSNTASNQPVVTLNASAASIGTMFLHDFSVRNLAGPTSRLGGSHGISCITTTGHKAVDLRLERINAVSLGDDGFHLEGYDVGGAAIVLVHAVALEAIDCQGSGFYIANSTVVECHNCYANGNLLFGAFCYVAQVAWYSCAFENNCRYGEDAYVKYGVTTGDRYTPDWGAQLRMKLCIPARVESCDFENFGDWGAGAPDGVPSIRHTKHAIIYRGLQRCLVVEHEFSE